MSLSWLEFAQKLAQGARAKAALDRQRLELLQAQLPSRQHKVELNTSRQ
jgi:hypothetical protein